MAKRRFILSGGGTGGHIFPAIAIADTLKQRYPDAEFLFVGARDRMEMQRVPAAGYPIKGIWISGIRRSLSADNLVFPVKLMSSLWDARKILREFKPDIAIGTGGFASGPLLYAASAKGIPCVIQEQNSFPGITNKLLSRKADAICVAFENMERYFPADKLILTGNPIRQDLLKSGLDPKEAKKKMGVHTDKPCLLVLGGSLGARKINALIQQHRAEIEKLGISLLWQCGKLYAESLKAQHIQEEGENFRLLPFIDSMSTAYAAADMVVSRAGAGTLSELAALKKASMLIPSPNVAEDHQTKNARALSNSGAALLFRESDSNFMEVLENLAKAETRKTLSENIQAFARPQAAEHIADEIEKLLPHAG